MNNMNTFESFLRYYTGLGVMDFYNLHSLEEGELILKRLFGEWIEMYKPSEMLQAIAKQILNDLGYEI